MSKYRFKKNKSLIPVKEPKIGQKYHVTWGRSRGVVGICNAIDWGSRTVTLRNPKTKSEFKYPVKWEDLRHTRKNQVKNPH